MSFNNHTTSSQSKVVKYTSRNLSLALTVRHNLPPPSHHHDIRCVIISTLCLRRFFSMTRRTVQGRPGHSGPVWASPLIPHGSREWSTVAASRDLSDSAAACSFSTASIPSRLSFRPLVFPKPFAVGGSSARFGFIQVLLCFLISGYELKQR